MILMALILVSEGITGVNAKSVYADQIGLDYAYTTEPRLRMTFTGNSVDCSLNCSLNKASSTVVGTLALHDITKNKDIASWSISGTGRIRTKKTATVTKGNKYRLTFIATVKTTKNKTEQINVSIEKDNK